MPEPDEQIGAFRPVGEPIDPTIWKPSEKLINFATKRCSWINCDQINTLEGVEWLRAIVVGAYYQGLADGVKHMAKKHRKALEEEGGAA